MPRKPIQLNADTCASPYAILTGAGHSAAKAAEIALDARRADPFATSWIAALRNAAKRAEAAEAQHG